MPGLRDAGGLDHAQVKSLGITDTLALFEAISTLLRLCAAGCSVPAGHLEVVAEVLAAHPLSTGQTADGRLRLRLLGRSDSPAQIAPLPQPSCGWC